MEGIILLFVVLAIINALGKAAKRGTRGSTPRSYPGKPGLPELDWKTEDLRFSPEEESPPAGPAMRLQPPLPDTRAGDGGVTREEIRRQDGAAAFPAFRGGEPVYTPAGGVERLFSTRDGFLAAIVLHELLQPPVSRRHL